MREVKNVSEHREDATTHRVALTAVTTVLLVGVGKFSRFRRSVVLSWSRGD
jgi:hypothetical protein